MIPIKWGSHLSGEERVSFEKEVVAAKRVLERLYTLLEEEYSISDKEMHKRENFFMPAWAEKQAFELGIQKALKSTMKLTKV